MFQGPGRIMVLRNLPPANASYRPVIARLASRRRPEPRDKFERPSADRLCRMPFSACDLRRSAVLALILAVQAGWFAVSTSGTRTNGYLWNGSSITATAISASLPEDGIAPLPILLSMAAPAALDLREYASAIRVARVCDRALRHSARPGDVCDAAWRLWPRRGCDRRGADRAVAEHHRACGARHNGRVLRPRRAGCARRAVRYVEERTRLASLGSPRR